MQKYAAYNKALSVLTAHDSTQPFILLRDCGDHIECIASAPPSFIATSVCSMLEDLRDGVDGGDKDAMTIHLLQHAGMTRWQILKGAVLNLFSEDCKHGHSESLPL